MVIIRDEKRIERLSRVSKGVSLFGIVSLIGGLVLALTTGAEGDGPVTQYLGSTENVFRVQLAALGIGWICSQIGMYLAHRYVRSPRPDEVLDEALGRIAKNGRLYHYVLPASHVLLSASGIIIFLAKYQTGNITVADDKWKQTGLGLRRFFGQENLGNPTREADNQLQLLADFIRKNAPEIEELPMATLIVFTHIGQKELDVNNTRIPTMHHSKVKSYLRRKRRNQPIDQETYQALQHAFDEKAKHILE
ncbi:MAG: NERD domain-containing protein [Chloroflexota bacterium]